MKAVGGVAPLCTNGSTRDPPLRCPSRARQGAGPRQTFLACSLGGAVACGASAGSPLAGAPRPPQSAGGAPSKQGFRGPGRARPASFCSGPAPSPSPAHPEVQPALSAAGAGAGAGAGAAAAAAAFTGRRRRGLWHGLGLRHGASQPRPGRAGPARGTSARGAATAAVAVVAAGTDRRQVLEAGLGEVCARWAPGPPPPHCLGLCLSLCSSVRPAPCLRAPAHGAPRLSRRRQGPLPRASPGRADPRAARPPSAEPPSLPRPSRAGPWLRSCERIRWTWTRTSRRRAGRARVPGLCRSRTWPATRTGRWAQE